MGDLAEISTEGGTGPAPAIQRRGAVAIIVRDGRWLVIRRAAHVEAPGAYCFPGGAIEPGESECDALCRELLEELGVAVLPTRRVWECVTPWGVHLAWWLADLPRDQQPVANLAEVAEVAWLEWPALRSLEGLLASNVALLDAVERGEITMEGMHG